MEKEIDPNKFIKLLRNSEPDKLKEIYTFGACYKLFLLLKYVFPDAKAYFNKEKNHIITKIGDCFYDINGKVKLNSRDYDNLELTKKQHKECNKWRYSYHSK